MQHFFPQKSATAPPVVEEERWQPVFLSSHSSISCFTFLHPFKNNIPLCQQQQNLKQTKSDRNYKMTVTLSHTEKKQLKVTKQKIKDNTKNKHIFMFFCLCVSKTKAQATFKKWTCANKMGQMQNCAPLQHQLHICLLIPNWLLPLHVSACFCCCFWTNIAIDWSAFVVLEIWRIKSHTG